MPSSNPKEKTVNKEELKTAFGSIAISEAAVAQLAGAAAKGGGHNIVTMDVPTTQSVASFSADKLNDKDRLKYSQIMGKGARSRQSSRFRLNELSRGPLSVEAEEEARIEAEVEKRVSVQLTQAKEQVLKDAYEEGFAVGKQEGNAEIKLECQPLVTHFDELIAQFENAKNEIYKNNEEFIMRTVYRLARRVVLKELSDDQDYTRRLILQLLDRLAIRDNVKIFVGEAVYSSAERLREGLALSLGELKNISIEMDSSIDGRGVRIETEHGEIDAQIDAQIEAIAQALGVQPESAQVAK